MNKNPIAQGVGNSTVPLIQLQLNAIQRFLGSEHEARVPKYSYNKEWYVGSS